MRKEIHQCGVPVNGGVLKWETGVVEATRALAQEQKQIDDQDVLNMIRTSEEAMRAWDKLWVEWGLGKEDMGLARFKFYA